MTEREDPGPNVYERSGLPRDIDQQLAVALQTKCVELCSVEGKGILMEPVLVAFGTLMAAFISQHPDPPTAFADWVTTVSIILKREMEKDAAKTRQ